MGLELAAFGLAILVAWWLGSIGTTAWLARVAKLGLSAPSEPVVRGSARIACLYFTVGIGALAAARVWCVRKAESAINVPWLLPVAVGAALFGLAVHLGTVEVSKGAALLPTAGGFAQGFLVGCVLAAGILVAPVDIAELAARARKPIAITIAAIFAALAVAGSGPAGSGTRINLGPLQPIELIKPLAILFLAVYLGSRASKLRWHRTRFLRLRWPRMDLLVPAVGVLLLIVAGLYVIGDLGPVLLLALVFLGMFFVVSRATGWVVVALSILGGVLALLATWPGLAGSGTVKTRLVMWTDPWTNGLTNGSQLGEGLWAMSAGGWQGQGLGRALTPLVPAGKTDLVLATLTEQMGALGLVAYQLALAALVIGALYVAARSRTAERVLIASGIAILFLAQWFVILGGTLGFLPLTGIVVPFVSAGRTSMAVFVALVALVARLATDGRVRVASTELDELHASTRGVRDLATLAIVFAIAASVNAAVGVRNTIATHTILARLRDGTLIARQNPRLAVLAARVRRGEILDRNGIALATSPTPTTRKYPLGNALGTLMGVSPAKVLLPPWALERQFDAKLTGYADLAGFVPLLDLDDTAREKALAARDADIASRSVKLTLDSKLQAKVAALARDAGKSWLTVAAVVMNAQTGEVLARVQVPDYDPNQPAWQDRVLANDTSFLARFRGAYGEWPDKTGTQGMYQSGSVGKLFTAIAAVRANVPASQRFECREEDDQGPLFTLKGWPKPIHDHTKDRPHGNPDLVEAIAVSCNVYFAQLGLLLGPHPFEELRKAGLEIGYGTKLVPGDPGSRQLASTAFGQGVMAMNVMQAARMVAAIANGGRYIKCPPTMELGAKCTESQLVPDPASLDVIRTGMSDVMTHGTGARLSPPAGIRVYGKTGTADVRGFAGEQPFGIAPRQIAAPHSWFVAFAESAQGGTSSSRIVVAVVIPRGGTGASAAGPLAMQILAAARDLGYLP
ncbi:MAG TPA: FtsW/RodA/SpoVE family cell cycle protein [Kofleriaceae bacterium]|nr:FtsW/RodA/SpoVE family cell cycle protein [Kofleriaceae bacterium]